HRPMAATATARRARTAATGSGTRGIMSGVGVVEAGITVLSAGGATIWSPGLKERKTDGAVAGRARSLTVALAWARRPFATTTVAGATLAASACRRSRSAIQSL